MTPNEAPPTVPQPMTIRSPSHVAPRRSDRRLASANLDDPATCRDVDRTTKMRARDVSVFYGDKQALKDVSINIYDDLVTAFIGPSGCGKSTFLRCLNRMNDTIPAPA